MLTAEQLEKRRSHLGATDLVAILGMSPKKADGTPWKTGAQVFAEKTGRIRDIVATEVMKLGNILEPGLLAAEAEELEPTSRAEAPEWEHPDGVLLVHPDDVFGFKGKPSLIVEAKTSGILWAGEWLDQWGEEHTDIVPESVIVQVHGQHLVGKRVGLDLCDYVHVVALLGGRGRVRYKVPISDDVSSTIEESGHDFWNKYVKTDTPPPEYDATLGFEAARRLIRKSGLRRPEPLPLEPMETWQDLRQKRLDTEKEEEKALGVVLTMLGDADEAEVEGMAAKLMTYREQEQRRKATEAKVLNFRVARLVKRP